MFFSTTLRIRLALGIVIRSISLAPFLQMDKSTI